jgi:hypothetical protein
MNAILALVKGRIPAVVQALLGILTMSGVAVPEDAGKILVDNLNLVLGGVMVLTAFVPSLLQKKK